MVSTFSVITSLIRNLFSAKKIDIFYFSTKTFCGYTFEKRRIDASNECSQHTFLSRNRKKNIYLIPPLTHVMFSLNNSNTYNTLFYSVSVFADRKVC